MKTAKGYVGEGRVLLGLSICHVGRLKDCQRCPYEKIGCGTRLCGDALRYIMDLERRVAEYEEEQESKCT